VHCNQEKNLKKTHSGFLGLSSDEKNVPNASSVASADEGGGVDEDNVSRIRLFVSTSFKSDDGNNNGKPPQPLLSCLLLISLVTAHR
jgi:hypothetical protein